MILIRQSETAVNWVSRGTTSECEAFAWTGRWLLSLEVACEVALHLRRSVMGS